MTTAETDVAVQKASRMLDAVGNALGCVAYRCERSAVFIPLASRLISSGVFDTDPERGVDYVGYDSPSETMAIRDFLSTKALEIRFRQPVPGPDSPFFLVFHWIRWLDVAVKDPTCLQSGQRVDWRAKHNIPNVSWELAR
jgi:hypothetical protein